MHRWMLGAIAPLAVLSLVAMVWMWPDPVPAPDGPGSLAQVAGTVEAIAPEPCAEDLPDEVNGCGTALVRFTDGGRAGEQERVPLPNGQGAPELDEGDDVLLIATDTPDGTTWAVVDHQRGTQLWILGIAFAVALVAFGRWRGLSAMVGLAVTFLVLVLFVVPAILGGDPPLVVAIVGAAVIALTVLYLTHGVSPSTSVAVVATLGLVAAVPVTTALAAIGTRGRW